MDPVKVAAVRAAAQERHRNAVNDQRAHQEDPMKTRSAMDGTARQPAAGDGVLVNARWLEEHLHDPEVRVVEVDVSRRAYDEWHIDGAVLWNVYQDLKDADYRLLDTSAAERLLARSGVGPGSTVVFYGYAPALGFWLMKLYGHHDVRILDGSRDAWRDEGHPVSSQPTEPARVGYVLPEPEVQLRAGPAVVRDAIGRHGSTLVDVRTWDEYRGERFWPSGGLEPDGRAGHIPSAVHQPIDGLYDERGSFRAAGDLRGVFSAVDLDGDGELISYCTIGGRACTAWFVLTYLLGRDHVRVYDGSWAEWGRMADTPVEQS
jgi:thiosulfate/3-mercaptopyruvate sulfurtransferase